MGQSKSAAGYPDSRAFMDRALAAEKGGRMKFDTRGGAISFRFRCYTTRRREQEQNFKMYEDQPDHPMRRTSIYHSLVLLLVPSDGAKIDPDKGTWFVDALHDPETITAHLGSYEDIE